MASGKSVVGWKCSSVCRLVCFVDCNGSSPVHTGAFDVVEVKRLKWQTVVGGGMTRMTRGGATPGHSGLNGSRAVDFSLLTGSQVFR